MIGNTLSYRMLLREAGGTWNRLDQCWEFSGDDPTDQACHGARSTGRPAPGTTPPRSNRSLTITAIAVACGSAS